MGLLVPREKLHVKHDWRDYKSLRRGFRPLGRDFYQTLRQDFKLSLMGYTSVTSLRRDFMLDPARGNYKSFRPGVWISLFNGTLQVRLHIEPDWQDYKYLKQCVRPLRRDFYQDLRKEIKLSLLGYNIVVSLRQDLYQAFKQEFKLSLLG